MDVPDFFKPSWIFEQIDDAIPETEKKRRAISQQLEDARAAQPGLVAAAFGIKPPYQDKEKDLLSRAMGSNQNWSRTSANDPTVDSEVKADRSMIRGGVTINIDSLIDTQNINTNNFKESPAQVKEQMTEALIEALREAEAYQ